MQHVHCHIHFPEVGASVACQFVIKVGWRIGDLPQIGDCLFMSVGIILWWGGVMLRWVWVISSPLGFTAATLVLGFQVAVTNLSHTTHALQATGYHVSAHVLSAGHITHSKTSFTSFPVTCCLSHCHYCQHGFHCPFPNLGFPVSPLPSRLHQVTADTILLLIA